ncbi:MAG: carboxylesterase family protein, partial [Myxococcota bacterium]
IQSGGGCTWRPLDRQGGAQPSAVEIGARVVTAAACDRATVAETRACLRSQSAEDLVAAQFMAGASALGLPPLGPNVDGRHLPSTTVERVQRDEGPRRAVITGSNADESRSFVTNVDIPDPETYERVVRAQLGALAESVLRIYPVGNFSSPKLAYEALVSDLSFICPALSFARALSEAGRPAFTYHFTHTLSGAAASLGAGHGTELFPLFEAWDTVRYTPVEADRSVGEALRRDWTAFAENGAPQGDWAPYPDIRIIASPPASTRNIRQGRCAELSALGL